VSRLFYSESGRIVRFLNEELSSRRRARKVLHLPQDVRSGGTLYVYAHPHKGCARPLKLTFNGHPFEIAPDGLQGFHWLALPLKREHVRPGPNTVELWCEGVAMDGWVLGLESNVRAADSALSLDGGATWQNERMGVLSCLRGEYVLRLRLDDGALEDPPPPAPVWEAPNYPLLLELRACVPPKVQSVSDTWQKARALSSWVSSQGRYRNTSNGIEYAPWDPFTILSWGKRQRGQEMSAPVVMCVHYGIVFVSAALSLGIPARNVCSTNAINGILGHFVSEVWVEKWQKWCQVDADCDIVYVMDGVPLCVSELHQAGARLPTLAQKGPGFRRQPAFVRELADQHFVTGDSFALWAIWPRNDYLSHPELTPTMHGAGSYHETEWLWARTASAATLGMFPYCLPPEQLQAPPPQQWRDAAGCR